MSALPKIQKTWKSPSQVLLPDDFCSGMALPELVLQTLYRRGLRTTNAARAFLDDQFYSPTSPYELVDMEKAIGRTLLAIQKGEQIGVWGDFDVDGQTSTAVLVSALRRCGAKVIYHVPIRGSESHGINLDVLKKFISQGIHLLITCDTGISEVEPIAYAQSKGVDVIVTDHHTLPETLPGAFALINPQFLPNAHPLHPLPGVGTAFKFAEALLNKANQADFSQTLIDLVAIGIIADIASLHGEARYLAQAGFREIHNSPRPSLRALLAAAEVEPQQFNEESVSFSVAPRLNAVGRLADTNPLVEFLLSEDPAVIAVTINQLEGLNARRKLLCDQVFEGALAQIEREPHLLDHPVLLLTHPEWHAGVVGITASRLVELFNRPVILLKAPFVEPMRGSARSIEGIDIITAIRHQTSNLISCGGHPMAAGLSLNPENFSAFQRGLDQTVLESLEKMPVERFLDIDANLSPQQIDFDFLTGVEKMAPFGAGNPALTFAAFNLHLVDAKPFGKTLDHLRIDVENDQGHTARLIWWQGAGMPIPEGIFDLAYTARTSSYRGEPQIQLEWVDFKPAISEIHIETQSRKAVLNWVDHRANAQTSVMLSDLVRELAPFVFAEGESARQVNGNSRLECVTNPNLVLWHLPPSPGVLLGILERVNPSTIHCFGNLPDENAPDLLLKSISRSVKQGLAAGETQFSLESLAAHSASINEIVYKTLLWLVSRGDIHLERLSSDVVEIKVGGLETPSQATRLRQDLHRSIEEIQAYRNFLQRVNLKTVLNPK